MRPPVAMRMGAVGASDEIALSVGSTGEIAMERLRAGIRIHDSWAACATDLAAENGNVIGR